MKGLISVLMVIVSVVHVLAQESETREVNSFRGIKASEAIDVYLKKGAKESVKVEVTGTKLSSVITEVAGTNLRIHMREGNHRNTTVKVYVTYVNLEKISVSSASSVFSEGPIKSSFFEIDISSAGSVEVSLEVDKLTVKASSAGDAVLEGKANTFNVEVSSAGDVDAYRLECLIVRANANSAGSIKVSATKELEAHANSAGSIRYHGSPAKTNTDSNSGGSVKKSN